MVSEHADLEQKLEEALAECARLQRENERLRKALGLSSDKSGRASPEQAAAPRETAAVPKAGLVTRESPSEAKIALFRSLFRGREDVYALRWETKRTGRSGYFPACANKWNRRVCRMPRVKCGACAHRKFLPLDDEAIRMHLEGRQTVGLYPMLADETCWLLVVDFDKAGWQEDAAAFLDTCKALSVPAYLERSRSGKGGHVWMFFDRPMEAAQARKLGCALLSRTLERRREIGLDSYDRLLPAQDSLPKGGFGNLIALPLQRGPRDAGNSVFLGNDFAPHVDQWAFLSTIRRLDAETLDAVVLEAVRTGKIVPVRRSFTPEEADEDPWTLPPSRERLRERPLVPGPLPKAVRAVWGNLLYVEKQGLPAPFLHALERLASFQNPEFYRAQAMRLPVFGKPRVVCCAEDFPRHLALPRGLVDEVVELFAEHGVRLEIQDERFPGRPVTVRFRGELSLFQERSAKAILAHDCGVLHGPTAFGKTVVAAWVIAARSVNTLVLVHRRQLMDQWRERLAAFLGLEADHVGLIGGGKDNPNGQIDIGILQSLVRKGRVKDLVADYGQVIVDECHHIPAASFEQVLRACRARYVLGLTATPIRKDGHHPIILMQCGPIRFRAWTAGRNGEDPFEHVVIPRLTSFRMPKPAAYEGDAQTDPEMHEIYAALASDPDRNELIVSDVIAAVEAGRSPLVLTERTRHLEALVERLQGAVPHLVPLQGGMTPARRKEAAEKLRSIPEAEKRVLVATGRYIGEGFDDARLDTLFLALPISWRGTLQQYAGRLHRVHEGKRIVEIYDYVDTAVPVLRRMYERRLKGYAAMGYKVRKPGKSSLPNGTTEKVPSKTP